MKSKSAWIIGISAGLIMVGAAVFLLLHRTARHDLELLELLPPGMDIYAAADVQSLRTNPLVKNLLANPPGLPQDQEYERFIQATGFRYENDLKSLAAARSGAEWVGAARVALDQPRVIRYMESQGAEKKDALGKTVFTFGRSRPFRLVFLDDRQGDTLVAFTVGGDGNRIQQAVERRLGHTTGSGASEFQQQGDLAHIPPESKVWLVARPDKLWGADGEAPQVGSFALNKGFFRGSKAIYISMESQSGQLSFHAEDYCDGPASAQRIQGALKGILALVQATYANKSKAASAFVNGLSVEQVQQSVMLQWQLDEATLRFLEEGAR